MKKNAIDITDYISAILFGLGFWWLWSVNEAVVIGLIGYTLILIKSKFNE